MAKSIKNRRDSFVTRADLASKSGKTLPSLATESDRRFPSLYAEEIDNHWYVKRKKKVN